MQKVNSNAREETLKQLIEAKKHHLKHAPPGTLVITTIRGSVRYYQSLPEQKGLGTYLGKKDFELARALAQKSYDRSVLRAAEQELKAWQLLAKHFPDMTVEEVYAALSPARRKLVTPVRPTDEEFRKQWEAVPYESGLFRPDAAVYITDRGERVRSKSEQLIANMLYRLGIPYRYEYPVTILVHGKKRVWRPDFMILDVKNRKEYYLEHFGKLDDQDEQDNYARNAFGKMKIYEENGMYEGGCMIYSFETSRAPLDITYLEQKVRRVLGI